MPSDLFKEAGNGSTKMRETFLWESLKVARLNEPSSVNYARAAAVASSAVRARV